MRRHGRKHDRKGHVLLPHLLVAASAIIARETRLAIFYQNLFGLPLVLSHAAVTFFLIVPPTRFCISLRNQDQRGTCLVERPARGWLVAVTRALSYITNDIVGRTRRGPGSCVARVVEGTAAAKVFPPLSHAGTEPSPRLADDTLYRKVGPR